MNIDTSLPALTGLFDSHAHLNDNRFDADREDVLTALPREGIELCMCIGSNMETSDSSVALARRVSYMYAAVGIHPHDAKEFTEADVPQLTQWLMKEPKVRALGEIGLDYYYDLSPRDTQRTVFDRQLTLAHELNVPVVLHIRDAHGDALDMLRARKNALPEMVLHCCTASWESAKVYLNLGCRISFTGPVTFKRSVNLQEVAKNVPLDRLMIETDSPYLAPEPVRGRRNDPRNVAHICRFIAGLRGMEAQELADATRENAKAFYRIQG